MTTFTTQDRIDATPFIELVFDEKFVLRLYRIGNQDLYRINLTQTEAQELQELINSVAWSSKENATLREQIKHLESQVYGGTTK